MKKQILLTAAQAGQRLDVALAKATDKTRSFWTHQLRSGKVLLSNKPAQANYIVTGSEQLDIIASEPAAQAEVPDVPVIYEDKDVLIVDKPAGLLVHAVPGKGGQPTLAAFAKSKTEDDDPDRAGLVHRLDRDTSGLLVIAKTKAAKAFMQAAFKDRTIHKTYTALVVGDLEPDTATVNLPIGRKPSAPTIRTVIAGGKPAVTDYRVIAHYPGYSLVEASPKTGRTHQLRVHFSALGHPIAGDTVYCKQAEGFGRQFLHATRLEFDGPSGQHIAVESPLPTELADILNSLEETV